MTSYIRVRDPETGHKFSTPVGDPLIKKGLLEVIDETPVGYLLPPKPHRNLDPAARAEGEPAPAIGPAEEPTEPAPTRSRTRTRQEA